MRRGLPQSQAGLGATWSGVCWGPIPVLLGEGAVPRPQATQWRTHGISSLTSTCMTPASRSTARARRRSMAQKHLWAEDPSALSTGPGRSLCCLSPSLPAPPPQRPCNSLCPSPTVPWPVGSLGWGRSPGWALVIRHPPTSLPALSTAQKLGEAKRGTYSLGGRGQSEVKTGLGTHNPEQGTLRDGPD